MSVEGTRERKRERERERERDDVEIERVQNHLISNFNVKGYHLQIN